MFDWIQDPSKPKASKKRKERAAEKVAQSVRPRKQSLKHVPSGRIEGQKG